ncbi:hypothetical protein C8R42DRAFT_724288 [Lentinula raphanica]|nr:hypothetical protein C8R42DRAFT_724288 [Lentinula raphanica]
MFSGAHDFNISEAIFNASGGDINNNYYYLSSDEEEKLRTWIAAPDSSINFSAALDKRLEGIGEWILEDSTFLKWRKEEKGGNILWIQGKAGSGKTILMQVY